MNMSTLNYFAQLDSLITSEVNVKKLTRVVFETERGTLSLVFEAETQKYFFTLGDEKIQNTPKLELAIIQVLEEAYKKP